MRALSLTQPWATVILQRGKRIENRQRWSGCSFRGTILLHAAKGTGTLDDFDSTVDSLMHDMGVPREYVEQALAQRSYRKREWLWTPLDSLPRGGLVGRARIDGVIKNDADFAAYAANVPGGAEQRKWWFGGFALVLADVEALPFVPWKGELGLFEVDLGQLPEAYQHLAA